MRRFFGGVAAGLHKETFHLYVSFAYRSVFASLLGAIPFFHARSRIICCTRLGFTLYDHWTACDRQGWVSGARKRQTEIVSLLNELRRIVRPSGLMSASPALSPATDNVSTATPVLRSQTSGAEFV